MKLTEERIALLSRLTNQQAYVHVEDVYPDNEKRPGTKVTIILPIDIGLHE